MSLSQLVTHMLGTSRISFLEQVHQESNNHVSRRGRRIGLWFGPEPNLQHQLLWICYKELPTVRYEAPRACEIRQ